MGVVRLDASRGHKGWTTYHAERCQVLRHVTWVDDETRQWGEYMEPYRHVDGRLLQRVNNAKRILILPDRKLIVINPVGVGDRWVSLGDVLVPHKVMEER